MADPATLVRRYYEALDAHEYDRLAELLDPAFVQQRPDRTFEGREAFVRFMREDRPMTDTRHELLDVFAEDPDAAVEDDEAEGGDVGSAGGDDEAESESGRRATARGRLLDADGEPVFEFADHFRVEGGRIVRLDTYSR